MRPILLASTTLALGLALTATAGAVKNVKYPEVKVEVPAPFAPDPAFDALRKSLADAVARKDAAALAALVAPTFVWTVNGNLTEQLDLGRDASHNFRVAFGFREPGKDVDGPVEGGPFWDALGELVQNVTYEKAEGSNLVCGPISATADEAALEKARKAIQTPDEAVDWYYTAPNTPVAKAPGDSGPPIATVGRIAVPVLDVHPPAPEGQEAPPATHYQVLLPTGKPGWVAVSAVRPLASDRLCYSKTADGQWRISSYDQVDQEQ